jgi:hypothetical protein
MLAAVLAAVLVTAPPTDVTRSVLTDVCLPFAQGEGASQDALDFLGFVGPAATPGEVRELRTGDEAYILRISSDDGEESGEVRRTCVLQARRGGLEGAKTSLGAPLREAGFVADAAQPAERPVWTLRGVSVSIRQSEGRATVIRINYSSLDEEA